MTAPFEDGEGYFDFLWLFRIFVPLLILQFIIMLILFLLFDTICHSESFGIKDA